MYKSAGLNRHLWAALFSEVDVSCLFSKRCPCDSVPLERRFLFLHSQKKPHFPCPCPYGCTAFEHLACSFHIGKCVKPAGSLFPESFAATSQSSMVGVIPKQSGDILDLNKYFDTVSTFLFIKEEIIRDGFHAFQTKTKQCILGRASRVL